MPTTINTKTGAVTVKQGAPSAPGEKVDTSAAKVVPPSPEVKTEAAAREVAGQKKATQAKIGALAEGMVGTDGQPAATLPHPARVKAVKGRGSSAKAKPAAAKAKPAAKKPAATKGRVDRLTTEWTGKDKKDVAVKDRVKTAEGIVIDVIGRWTRKTKDGALVPMVTGHIVSLPAGATVAAGDTKKSDAKGRSKGDRQNAIAAGCTHVKK